MEYKINCYMENGTVLIDEAIVTATCNTQTEQAFFTMDISFPSWNKDAYTFMPACVYGGNKIRRVTRPYPPMYHPGEGKEPLMTDIPSLNPDGSGTIEVTTGDMATPCVGFWNPKTKESFFLFTVQDVKGKNIGISFSEGKISLSFPANRNKIYRFCNAPDFGSDKGIPMNANEHISVPYRIFVSECADIPAFYAQFIRSRKCLLNDKRAPFLYSKALWDKMEAYFNTHSFTGKCYAPGSSKEWQPGWVGGGISSYPLLAHGTELSKNRCRMTLDFLTSHQAESGFYHGFDGTGRFKDDSFNTPGMEGLHLVRKSADALYFLLKHFELCPPEQNWVESAKKCADGFVKLFETYGTFGQFIHIETAKMKVYGTHSAVMGCAALVKAWRFFRNEQYLAVAKKALLHYCDLFEKTGITNGGPGEILGAPDSESAFALLESCVLMLEETNDDAWLPYAETAAHYCSSWVVSYRYRFPEGSEFHRLHINTVGSVFANVQNKHSAPGICTLSGDSLLKLYRYTKNKAYLDLIKDISYFIPQCVSTKEKPIHDRFGPAPVKLPEGFICERVNMSDWEYDRGIGNVFCASCWCDASLTLSFTELMTQEEMVP
ncbi:MAG: hypothetical protein IJC78_03350 [Clostridia bacterium]|nr:hypothetical protein [Clostridia bacterium]